MTAAMKSCRASGSSIAIGSSSTSSWGRLASARVSASCACCPPDSLPALRSSGMPSSSSRAPGVAVVEAPVQVARQVQHVGGGQVLVQRRVLRDERDAVQRGGRPRGPAAEHRDGRLRSARPGRRRGSAGWSCRRRWGRPAQPRARRESPACTPAAPSCRRSDLPRPRASMMFMRRPPMRPAAAPRRSRGARRGAHRNPAARS